MGLRPRRQSGRPIKSRVLIVGEGKKTEPYYFRGLRAEKAVDSRFAATVCKGPGYTPEAVVREAIKRKKEAAQSREGYQEVWCVLDVEGPDRRESLDAAAKLAKANGIGFVLSNPVFEVWLLAHFIRTSRAFLDCDAVIQELDRHWPEVAKEKHGKGDERIYQRLAGRTGTAIDNARAVRENDHKHVADTADANSSTEVYRIVGRLLGQ